MLIEQTTTYAFKLKYLDNPSFDKVKNLAKKFIDELPKKLVDDLYNSINRGVDILKTEPEMLVYLYSFGNMHQAKLNKAFENIPEILFDQPEINIIDYGCGQAIGTMCYADFLKSKNYNQQIKSVTLIEPSKKCLRRAALHTSIFFPDAEITTVNKTFDELAEEDINCGEDVPTLHILSNVLDLEFNISKFTKLVKGRLKGYNQFVCVGPYFGYDKKDFRMEDFAISIGAKITYSEAFGKGQFVEGKNWTCQTVVASVGELEEDLSTEVTEEDIADGVEDEFGVVYSRDGKRLLRCKNDKLEEYTIKEGTKIICNYAFYLETENLDPYYCNGLVLKKITIPNSVKIIGRGAFADLEEIQYMVIPNGVVRIKKEAFSQCASLLCIILPDSILELGEFAFWECGSLQHIKLPYSIKDIGVNTFLGCSLETIIIPNSVTKICDSAFSGCSKLQHITLPNSLSTIEYNTFTGCSSLQTINIPDSVSRIENWAFSDCESLQKIFLPDSIMQIADRAFENCKNIQQIIIPEGSVDKFKKMLPEKLWDKLYFLKKAVELQGEDDNDLPF